MNYYFISTSQSICHKCTNYRAHIYGEKCKVYSHCFLSSRMNTFRCKIHPSWHLWYLTEHHEWVEYMLNYTWYISKTNLKFYSISSSSAYASCNYTVLFLSRDVENTKFNQYLPVDLTLYNLSNSRFRKPVMFWRWCPHGVALWRHGHGAWHNCLLLVTASNINCWADDANHVTWL